MNHRLSVTLSLSGLVKHHRYLAEALAHRGILRRAVLLGRELEISAPGREGVLPFRRRIESYRLCNRLAWAVWRRLPWVSEAPLPVIAISWIADWALARSLPNSDVFHGLAGVSLASLHQAKRRGAITILDNATLHPSAWQREVLSECALSGISPNDCERRIPRWLLDRHELEYALCDRIIVYSSASQRTFDSSSYAQKVRVVHPGVDYDFFTPVKTLQPKRVFRVCYVGRIEPAKGVNYLLAAWNHLKLPNAELVLVGRLLPGIDPAFLASDSRGSVRFAGMMSQHDLAACYRQSDLFVFPSMNEGLSLAVLEAMSCGIPVIACVGTGAVDCITPGQNGYLVPGRNIEALADAIFWAYTHRDALPVLGRNARSTIEQRFTLSKYEERLLSLYNEAHWIQGAAASSVNIHAQWGFR